METLAEVKIHLRKNWEKGTKCPACGQHVQVYRYKLFMTSAVALIQLYILSIKNPTTEYFHVSKFAEANTTKIRSPHFAELRFWNLVRPMDSKTGTHNASGFWKITEKGKTFVRGRESVAKYIKIYNNKFVGFEGDQVTIKDCLGNKFDYSEVMFGYEDSGEDIQGRLF